MIKIKFGSANVPYGEYQLLKYKYQTDDSICLRLFDGYEPVMTFTTCLDLPNLDETQVLLKTWGENEGIVAGLIEAGVLTQHIGSHPTGFCQAELFQLSKEVVADTILT